MASMDPLQALTAALSVPADSKEQADLLAALRETLEAQPHPIPILCNTLLKTAAGSNDSLLKRWVLELLHFGIARAPLSVEARTNRACCLFFFFPFSGCSYMLIVLIFSLTGAARAHIFCSLLFFHSNFLVAGQSLDVLAGLLNDGKAWTVKIAVQTLAGAYPLLFRRMCVTHRLDLDPPGTNNPSPLVSLFNLNIDVRIRMNGRCGTRSRA